MIKFCCEIGSFGRLLRWNRDKNSDNPIFNFPTFDSVRNLVGKMSTMSPSPFDFKLIVVVLTGMIYHIPRCIYLVQFFSLQYQTLHGIEPLGLREIIGGNDEAIRLYQLFKDPQSNPKQREYSFMTIGPTSPLSFSGIPLFFQAMQNILMSSLRRICNSLIQTLRQSKSYLLQP
jgi:hypothetical protein